MPVRTDRGVSLIIGDHQNDVRSLPKGRPGKEQQTQCQFHLIGSLGNSPWLDKSFFSFDRWGVSSTIASY
jgi:hypothetical protein